ncbi:MAG: DegT/DnrJ/EryC1/StrS family aminotransferase [Rhodospirillales bacterium]|nr:DegT/DnrJ/EryC1/StrS family aminotransferase [Rhodospirillales bacterium]
MRVFYAQAVYGDEEIEAVTQVLKNKSLTLMDGPSVRTFEARVAETFGKRFGLMVNSGSSANALAVASLGLQDGDEVITPALTFSTTVAPLIQQGLVPVFVDAEPDSYVIDPDQIERMVGPKTRAMMIPNLIGNLAHWGALKEIADRHGLKTIEDSADTIGSLYKGQPTGNLSDIATTSFFASHVMTGAGFGGMVCYNDEETYRKAKQLRGWGRSSSLVGESEAIEDRFNIRIDGVEYDSKFVFGDVGYNFMPSEISAAFGLVQLDRLSDYGARRERNFKSLCDFFADYEEWFVLPRQQPETRTYWLAVPLIVRSDAPFSRRELQVYFESNDIQTRTVFTGNILRQPGFANIEHRADPAGYPNADRVMEGGILLGCHQGMDQRQVEYMFDVFKSFAQRY